MKRKYLIYIVILLISLINLNAQDSIYVMKNGVVSLKFALAEIDSMSFTNAAVVNNTLEKKIAVEADFSLFHEALLETGLIDSLKPYRDKTYDPDLYKYLIKVPKSENSWFYHQIPLARNYGFTVLMESNNTLAASGIKNLADLKQYAALAYDPLFPDDASISNPADRKNSLNRFIAYHIIPKKLSSEQFINRYDTDHMIKSYDLFEYIETLCPNTLIEIKKDRQNGETNLINSHNSSATVRLSDRKDVNASNGYFHEIDKILTYSQQLHNYLSSKPLRFDFASFFPELTNNNMRGLLFEQNSSVTLYRNQTINFQLPPNYLGNLKASANTIVGYLPGYARIQDYMADELYVTGISYTTATFDFSLKTLTIPAGTYEIRIGMLNNGKRGVPDISIDGIPADRLRDLNNATTHRTIGYQVPGSNPNDPEGFENDKLLRNHGFMKSPASFKVAETGWTTGLNSRYSQSNFRLILGTFNFSQTQKHEIKVEMKAGGEFMLDYIEFIPVTFLEEESIY